MKIATSNIPFSEWATLFSDDKVPSAILDSLFHCAYVVSIIGVLISQKIMVVLNNYIFIFYHFCTDIFMF